MTKKLITFLLAFSTIVTVNFFPNSVEAQIKNNAIGVWGTFPDAAKSGGTFVGYFITIWNALIVVGALLVVMFFLWGAIGWITSGGDSGKLTEARNKMVQAVIGLIILVTSYTLIGFISTLFFGAEFNILKPIINL